MDVKSEVILRQIERLKGQILFINPPPDELAIILQQHTQQSIIIWTWNFADYQYFQKQAQANPHIQTYFQIHIPNSHFQHIIIFNPKIKAQLNYLLHQISATQALNTEVYLIGEKNAGIEGSAKLLKPYGKTIKIDTARHCQYWQMYLETQETLRPISDWQNSYLLECDHKSIEIISLVGVFSQNKLDMGTAQLLPYLKQIKTGKIADFGCGAGVIACYLAVRNPQHQIIAYDVDAFALTSLQMTLEKNQIQNVQFKAIQGIADLDNDFDCIVSNPPFHQGVKTHYQVSEDLCQQSHAHLNKHGELWLVFNDFLNYPSLLKPHFQSIIKHQHQRGFYVLQAHNQGK